MQTKTKVLVIEDEVNIRENIQELLEAKGYNVRTATNGKQGILEAIDYRPHLILCDVMMPKMDGFKVLEQIRKSSNVQNVPFIFLTAKVEKQDLRHGMEMGADDYISKPFTSKELMSAIEARLKRHEKLNTQYSKAKHELDTSVFANYYHQFNTPLSGMVGALNLLVSARKSFGEKQVQDLLVSTLKSAIRLNHVLSNLMLYEELKRADVHPELQTMFTGGQAPSGWQSKIKDELSIIAHQIYNRADDISIEFNNSIDLGISFEYLLRIMIEVTDNALKFSKPGQKVIIRGNKNDEKYIFEIVDHGSGFLINNLEEISAFKQFNSKRFSQQGLGLGLHLVKQLVGFNRGEIKINSVEEQGTTLTIELPLLDSE
jgi:DNA-binding response OmpR family regulator